MLKSSGGRLLYGKCLPRGDFFPAQILRGETFPGGGPVIGQRHDESADRSCHLPTTDETGVHTSVTSAR